MDDNKETIFSLTEDMKKILQQGFTHKVSLKLLRAIANDAWLRGGTFRNKPRANTLKTIAEKYGYGVE